MHTFPPCPTSSAFSAAQIPLCLLCFVLPAQKHPTPHFTASTLLLNLMPTTIAMMSGSSFQSCLPCNPSFSPLPSPPPLPNPTAQIGLDGFTGNHHPNASPSLIQPTFPQTAPHNSCLRLQAFPHTLGCIALTPAQTNNSAKPKGLHQAFGTLQATAQTPQLPLLDEMTVGDRHTMPTPPQQQTSQDYQLQSHQHQQQPQTLPNALQSMYNAVSLAQQPVPQQTMMMLAQAASAGRQPAMNVQAGIAQQAQHQQQHQPSTVDDKEGVPMTKRPKQEQQQPQAQTHAAPFQPPGQDAALQQLHLQQLLLQLQQQQQQQPLPAPGSTLHPFMSMYGGWNNPPWATVPDHAQAQQQHTSAADAHPQRQQTQQEGSASTQPGLLAAETTPSSASPPSLAHQQPAASMFPTTANPAPYLSTPNSALSGLPAAAMFNPSIMAQLMATYPAAMAGLVPGFAPGMPGAAQTSAVQPTHLQRPHQQQQQQQQQDQPRQQQQSSLARSKRGRKPRPECPVCGGPGRHTATKLCSTCYGGVYNDIAKVYKDPKQALTVDGFVEGLKRLPRGCPRKNTCSKEHYSHRLPTYVKCTQCRTIAVAQHDPVTVQNLLEKRRQRLEQGGGGSGTGDDDSYDSPSIGASEEAKLEAGSDVAGSGAPKTKAPGDKKVAAQTPTVGADATPESTAAPPPPPASSSSTSTGPLGKKQRGSPKIGQDGSVHGTPRQ
ncbi:hypothetical protein PTSG_00329 [Salpingoeca rosetta]|uniref:Uncharacterized protein n=1 Tax=Salpingoeca rosetta (strain ATCC 50818 / BSB-021) TaxID=946362 RepID=F2TW65_SALR5|nr:uncharacterized protein PTSG_00329 [Salpingoeca rosetta]EGD72311.1 hypothetical protein PTSG_00329 [Salpingoeca rosetta]|eukprot:XP_004998881.1 hypothetical protein PTSG_00329 [Salpingoeca rosetta]